MMVSYFEPVRNTLSSPILVLFDETTLPKTKNLVDSIFSVLDIISIIFSPIPNLLLEDKYL